jgi:hypothetical protein
MISDFVEWGYKHLLSTTPQGVTRLIGGRANTLGINMNDALKEYMEGLIDAYIEHYWDHIPSEKILEECIKYGSVNTDRVIAWGICLIQMKEDVMVQRRASDQEGVMHLPQYKKTYGGRIIRV